MLTEAEVDRFVADGFVAVRGAVPSPVVAECGAQLAGELTQVGVALDDPATWAEPVVRFWCPESPAFEAAGTQPVLWDAYDQLLGPGRHVERRAVGGSVVTRFPSAVDPGDAGWHIDGSFPIGDGWGVNVHSRGRGLLCLFLFSDVGELDAPTEIKIGSHLLVPSTLEPLGEAGGLYDPKATDAFDDMLELPSVFATGAAGDVFVCHPFLVHRATWPHRGSRPRLIAQPEIGIGEQFSLTSTRPVYPVEQAILDGLHRQP